MAMMTDHWQVIEDALLEQRTNIEKYMTGWKPTSVTYKRYASELESIEATLAFVQQLAAHLALCKQHPDAGEWIPVEDGTYAAQHNGAYIEIDRDYLKVFEPLLGRDYGDEAEVALPDDLKLCRLKQEGK
jgi:hypothetical protein